MNVIQPLIRGHLVCVHTSHLIPKLVNSPDFCDSPAVSDAILGSKGDRCDGRGRGVDLQAPPIVA